MLNETYRKKKRPKKKQSDVLDYLGNDICVYVCMYVCMYMCVFVYVKMYMFMYMSIAVYVYHI